MRIVLVWLAAILAIVVMSLSFFRVMGEFISFSGYLVRACANPSLEGSAECSLNLFMARAFATLFFAIVLGCIGGSLFYVVKLHLRFL